MIKEPLVTILFPVFNAEDFLVEALDSLFKQTYTNFEILAINDGSTDSSRSILESISDNRMRIVDNEKNIGLIKTLNLGIPLSNGKYIVRADADDICLPMRLEKQVSFMESKPNVGISGTGFGSFGTNIPLTELGHFSADHNEIKFRHLYQIHLMHGTSIWKRATFLSNDIQFDPDFAHAEDYDLFDRLSLVTKLSNIPDVLYHIRLHGNSVSQKYSAVQEKNSVRIKKRIFKRIGVDITEGELELFRDFCHHDHIKLKGREPELADLILKVILGNRFTGYFPRGFLLTRLKKLWIGLCLANANPELNLVLQTHPIKQHLPFGIKTQAKFKLKSLKK